jgi:hypothetical protein
MENERDKYFKELQDRLDTSLDELPDTPADSPQEKEVEEELDPQKRYLDLIKKYEESSNKKYEPTTGDKVMDWMQAAGHIANAFNANRGFDPVKITDFSENRRKFRDEERKRELGDLSNLQGMYQKYMDMQRRTDQDKLGKERFDWQKTRAEKQDELRQRQYTDKEQERQLSNQLLQSKLDQLGQLTPYQQKMLEQQGLDRELKKELAQKKEQMTPYQKAQIELGEKKLAASQKKDKKDKGLDLTKGQIKADEAFAKDYNEYAAQGGIASIKSNINKLKEANNLLKSEEGPNLTGAGLGLVPDVVRNAVAPESIAVRDMVESVIQQSLRQILGAQFTEKEAERLIQRSYNERLDEATNAKKLDATIKELETMANAKEEAAKYFEKNGSLKGFKSDISGMIPKADKMVMMQAPNGQKARVPENKVQEYIDKGATIIEE